MLNKALFNRVKSVYERRDSLELTPEQSMVLEKVYKRFEREVQTWMKPVNQGYARSMKGFPC